MAKAFAKVFYKSKVWEDCRRGYIAERMLIDGGACEVCKKNPGYILHHKINLTPDNINNPEITLNWENLSWECKECHDKEEGHGVDNKKAGLLVEFDESGQPHPLPDSPPLSGSTGCSARGPVGEIDLIHRAFCSPPSPFEKR